MPTFVLLSVRPSYMLPQQILQFITREICEIDCPVIEASSF
jgi:hypothetical protein